MKVRELVEKLGDMNPEAEVHIPYDGAFGDSIEVDDVYESDTTYGLLTKEPTTVPTVKLVPWGHGL